MQSIFLCTSIGSALLLAASYSLSEPYDRSVLDLLISLGFSAVLLCVVQRYCPAVLDIARGQRGRYDGIPLEPLTERIVQQKDQNDSSLVRSSVRTRVKLIFTGAVALAARTELYRRISANAQCTSRSWEILVPLLLAINECRYHQKTGLEAGDLVGSDTHKNTPNRLKSHILRTRWRYVPSASILAYGCYLVTALWQAQSSTFICPITSGHTTSTPHLQQLAVLLDCLLAVIVQEMARTNSASRHRLLCLPYSCAAILLGSLMCWAVYAVMLFYARAEEMAWLLVDDTPSTTETIARYLYRGLLSSILCLSSIYCIASFGVYQLSVILATSITLFLSIGNLWSARNAFPPNTANVSLGSFLIIYFGAWSSYQIALSTGQMHSARALTWSVLAFIALLAVVLPGLRAPPKVDFHPIEMLMFNAKSQHEQYLNYIDHSTDLKNAVLVYQNRYKRNPPPGFDKWYEYARNRSVLVMDEYDQIYEDLLPFQTVLPADIRKQTWEAVSNPWNEISGISIRNGEAQVQENVLPTHRWMLEGVAVLINAFSKHLPDMDLAFNLNDEPRVAVPYSQLNARRSAAIIQGFQGTSSWSSDRSSTWSAVSTEPYQSTVFENYSFQKNFRRFGAVGCSPNTLSQTRPHLSSQSKLCLECIAPHSLGPFIANWTLAADMCHQPDMSHLHGFYLSPAAFKPTHELVPVFSQSKAQGYNDILYPSAWNYMDKVVYQPVNASGDHGTDTYSAGYPDPPYNEKQNILYWRGATSEGVSAGMHAWRGMTRQRLVHLANNATSNSDHDHTTILLPDLVEADRFTYYSLSGSAIKSLNLQNLTDIRFVDNIVRCGGWDCTDQEKEFGLVSPVNFQAHWKYRYLFDMDGAGFSGRFLPFLQSRSLPFKTALFREWYDSRITAWHHFVPIDLRLHGVWSTLAYFAGIDGTWPGSGSKRYKWEPHTMQGEAIAEEGRKWASRVLRKEDMEAYFFRLLLEWGRLTDDRRDQLGFVIPQ